MTNDPVQGLEDRVRRWLDEENWAVGPGRTQTSNSDWAIDAWHSGNKFVVGQPRNNGHTLVISARFDIGDLEPSEELVDAIDEIKTEFLHQRLEYSVAVSPAVRIEFYRRIYVDSVEDITRDQFWERMGDVHRGAIVVRDTMKRRGLISTD